MRNICLLALPTIIGIYWEVTVNWHYNTGNWWKTAAVIPGLLKGVSIESALFEFSQSEGSNDDPPLSWHLTDQQRAAIEAAWQKNLDNPKPDSELNKVIRFIAGRGTENEN